MFKTKKDYSETEMGTLIELLYGSIAIKEQALSNKIFLWEGTNSVCQLLSKDHIFSSICLI